MDAAAYTSAEAPAQCIKVGAVNTNEERRTTKLVNRIAWTREEDTIIVESVEELGHKWFRIAQRLPGRTDHAIRNRFHRLQSLAREKGAAGDDDIMSKLRKLVLEKVAE